MVKKKIKEIFIGSNNKGKLKEIADLLPKSLKIYSNLDFKIPSPIETGTTFTQNSLLKAKYFSKKTSKICLSDDSGIEIDILDRLKLCMIALSIFDGIFEFSSRRGLILCK